MAPIIKDYFASDECKTKVPKNNVMDKSLLPFAINNTVLAKAKHGAYSLDEMSKKNKLLTPAELELQFSVEIFGEGAHRIEDFNRHSVDLWLWQLSGNSELRLISENEEDYVLTEKDSLLINENYCNTIRIHVKNGGYLMKVTQDPNLKSLF